MDTAQWPQEIVMKSMEEIVQNTCSSKPSSSLERKIRPEKDKALNCPRCNSTNTKFCYYNNYSLSQPRYFCKTCRRYWTAGGSLRNIPVGGGSRKNKRSSSSSLSPSSSKRVNDLVVQPPQIISQTCLQNPKIHENQDLNLGFPPGHEFKTFTELIQVPNYDNNANNKENNMPCSSSTTSSQHLSAMELLTGITSSSSGGGGGGGVGFNSFLPISDPNTIYSSGGFSLPSDLKPSSLNFALDNSLGNSGFGGLQETSGGRLLFPFEDLKPVSNSTTTTTTTTVADAAHQTIDQSADSNGYWSGVLGGATW